MTIQVHGAADVDQDDEDDQPNVPDVKDCHLDKRHVEGGTIKESQPV